jgi:hypothetical protein
MTTVDRLDPPARARSTSQTSRLLDDKSTYVIMSRRSGWLEAHCWMAARPASRSLTAQYLSFAVSGAGVHSRAARSIGAR